MSLREKIRGLPTRQLTVLGEAVEIRSMSLQAWHAFIETVGKKPDGKTDPQDMLPRVVVACTFDKDGQPMFTADDVGWLKQESNPMAMAELFKTAAELNGLATQE